MFKKILKSKSFVTLAVAIINFYVFLLFLTCRFTIKQSAKSKEILDEKKLCIISYWHSRILIFPKFMTRYGKFAPVISSHGDGEFLSRAVSSYGHDPIRGSSGKNSLNAMRGILTALKSNCSICLTPDGPRGPRFQIKGNISNLAVKFHIPIIPICYSTSNAKILQTWDRFIIPFPFSKINIDISEPIFLKKADDLKVTEIMMAQMSELDKKLKLKVDY